MSAERPDPGARHAVEALVFAEARLLDEQRFEDWLALFTADAIYWVPGQPGQRSPHDALSLVYERKPLLALRVRRLAEPGIHVQTPPARTHHHVSAVEVRACADEDADYAADSSLIVAEWRGEDARWFAGRACHRLRIEAGTLRIVEKRVMLINCDAPHRAVAVPF